MALCFRRKWKSVLVLTVGVIVVLPFLFNHLTTDEVKAKKLVKEILKADKSPAIPPKVDDSASDNKSNIRRGAERRKFDKLVYIKISKTGSTTLHTILDSYGYLRKIPLLIPRTDGEGFNPRELNPGLSWDIAPNRKWPPKISAAHGRYHRIFFDKYFGTKAAYITSIREPVSWFVSHVDFINKITHEETAHDVLQSDRIFYKESNSVYQLDREYHNYFLDWLGFPLPKSYTYNETEILNYIKLIDEKFDLVIIMEYFPESLVLLRRTLKWSMKDIFYTHKNSAPYKSGTTLSTAEREKFLDADHNRGDWLLYQYFNKTLWRKISNSKEFHEEVEVFKKLNSQVFKFCNGVKLASNISLTLTLSTKWEPTIVVDDNICLSLSNRLYKIVHKTYAPFFGSVGVAELQLHKYKSPEPWPGLIETHSP